MITKEECDEMNSPSLVQYLASQIQVNTSSSAADSSSASASASASSRRNSSRGGGVDFFPPHYCKFCEKDMKSRDYFLAHFSTCHPTITDKDDMFVEPWRCLFCSDVFASANRLSLHIKSNHKNKISLKNKLLSDGDPTKLHECQICGLITKTAQYLVKHTLKMHGGELTKNGNDAVKDPRVCGICGQLCSGEQGLRCHLYWTHGKQVGKVDRAFKEFVDMELMASAEKSQVAQPPAAEKQPIAQQSKKMKSVAEKPVGAKKMKPLAKPVVSMLQSKNADVDSILHCGECRLTFENVDLIKRHRELRHVEVECPICAAICKGGIGLETHDDKVHFGSLKFQLVRHDDEFIQCGSTKYHGNR